jgi:iron-sulfur cluster assembly protein
MVEITEAAQEQLTEYFKGKEVAPIRLFLNQGGWGGPSLAMALDEPKDNDDVHEVNGFKFIVEKEFMEKAQPIKVDFNGMGFSISSSIEIEASGSDCSGCGTSSSDSGSCGTWVSTS